MLNNAQFSTLFEGVRPLCREDACINLAVELGR